ncbi:MAG TPA: GNAT family N-acetyltransferase, partial [Kofleriaceae bacterium]|nr:GNAT family N-acetyltransferase [Kofleriaceae bacterium]
MSARRVGPPDDDAELEELAPILVDSLNVPPERAGDLRARYDRTWFRLVREGGRVVGGLALVPAGQFFGGRRVDLAAVNAVAVAQEAR